MKVYPVKQYNAIQFRRGGYRVKRVSGWVACLNDRIVVTNTKREALQLIATAQA